MRRGEYALWPVEEKQVDKMSEPEQMCQKFNTVWPLQKHVFSTRGP